MFVFIRLCAEVASHKSTVDWTQIEKFNSINVGCVCVCRHRVHHSDRRRPGAINTHTHTRIKHAYTHTYLRASPCRGPAYARNSISTFDIKQCPIAPYRGGRSVGRPPRSKQTNRRLPQRPDRDARARHELTHIYSTILHASVCVCVFVHNICT